MISSSRFEEQNCHLPHVEIDKVLGLVSNVRTEIAANNTVPCRVVFLVKLLLDICCDILFNVELLQGHICAVNGILLHLLVHICMFDDCFPLSCGHSINQLDKCYKTCWGSTYREYMSWYKYRKFRLFSQNILIC